MRRLLLFLPFLLPATSEVIPQQDGPAFSVSVNLIKVPFSVFDAGGSLVSDLRREDFNIYEDGVRQDIRSFGIDRNPVSVVLVLDTSATVEKELKKITEAAEGFASALSKDDRISIIAFSDDVRVVQDWTDDDRKIRKALRKLEPGLRTALYDAMFAAANDQLRGIDGRKAIILLTDCLNNQSTLGFRDAAQSVVQSQASLYVVSKTVMVRQAAYKQRRVVMLADIYKKMFGDDNYVEEFFRKRESEMTDLSEKTGGRCFFPSDYDQIQGIYNEVARELKSKYYLTYVSNQPKSPDSYHEIVLEYLPPASKLVFRRGYYHEPRPIHKRRY
jgi:VWFA-related protein